MDKVSWADEAIAEFFFEVFRPQNGSWDENKMLSMLFKGQNEQQALSFA